MSFSHWEANSDDVNSQKNERKKLIALRIFTCVKKLNIYTHSPTNKYHILSNTYRILFFTFLYHIYIRFTLYTHFCICLTLFCFNFSTLFMYKSFHNLIFVYDQLFQQLAILEKKRKKKKKNVLFGRPTHWAMLPHCDIS